MSNEKLVGVLCPDDSDSLSECEEFYPESLLEKQPWDSGRTKLTKEELKMKTTYTYDPEPVKAWREITDYMAIQECNEGLWSKISQCIGKHHKYRNSLFLYRNRHSELVNVIERILCPKNCYFFPANCLFKHGYDFKNLLKRNLHQRFSPSFENLFQHDVTKVVQLERLKHGPPNMIKLAEDIGFTTSLEYDEDGFLRVDLSVFTEKFWDKERPSFVKEEKKVLDTVYALLISSSIKQENDALTAKEHYSQTVPGINDPVLKMMSFGPDHKLKSFITSEGACDLSKDESKAGELRNVRHEECSYLRREDHWTFVHHKIGDSDITCDNVDKENLKLDGPASAKDTSIIYPCNLNHCWRCCQCTFCQLTRQLKCKDHQNHIIYNIKKCKIQELAQCQDHWLDHPDNFNNAEDIKVELNILFHNKEVKRDGRNYCFKIIEYPGLKVVCKKCRKNTTEHMNNHLTPHLQCKHCLYEIKTMTELSFWRRVCNICGKILNDETLKMQHQKRHEETVSGCEVCGEQFSTNFNLHRHMLEQHDSFQGETGFKSQANEPYKCTSCAKTFKYERNLDRHIKSIHTRESERHCEICGQKFGIGFNLKAHLKEQHDVTEFECSIHSEEVNDFNCKVCDVVFKRKTNLKVHEMTHESTDKFTCDQCGKQYSVKTSLVRHQKIHRGEREKHKCLFCQKTFLSKGLLGRHMDGIHRS